jgi:competence protein ComEA
MKPIHPKGLALALAAAFILVPLLNVQAGVAAAADKININTATQADLDKLPRIGPKVAQRIVDFRKEHGPFKRVEDLMKVKGIGEKTFARLKDLVTVGPEAAQTK